MTLACFRRGEGPCGWSDLPGMPHSGLIHPFRAFFSLNVDAPAIYTTLQGDGCLLPAPFEPGSRAALHLERNLLDPCSQQRAEVRGSLIKRSNFDACCSDSFHPVDLICVPLICATHAADGRANSERGGRQRMRHERLAVHHAASGQAAAQGRPLRLGRLAVPFCPPHTASSEGELR